MDFWSIIFEYCDTYTLASASIICKSSYRMFIKLPFTFWKSRLEKEFPKHMSPYYIDLMKRNLFKEEPQGYDFYKLIYKDLIVNGAYYIEWKEIPYIKGLTVGLNPNFSNIDNWKRNVKGYYVLTNNPDGNNIVIISSSIEFSTSRLRFCEQELLLIPQKKIDKNQKRKFNKDGVNFHNFSIQEYLLFHLGNSDSKLLDKYNSYIIPKNLHINDYFQTITKYTKLVERIFPNYEAMFLRYLTSNNSEPTKIVVQLIRVKIEHKLSRFVKHDEIIDKNSPTSTCGGNGGKTKAGYCHKLGNFNVSFNDKFYKRCHLHPRNDSEIFLTDPLIEWIHFDPNKIEVDETFSVDWQFDDNDNHKQLIIKTHYNHTTNDKYNKILYRYDHYDRKEYYPFTHIEINGQVIELNKFNL